MGARLRQVSLVLIGRNTPSLNLRVYERTGRVFPKAVIQRPMQQRPLTRSFALARLDLLVVPVILPKTCVFQNRSVLGCYLNGKFANLRSFCVFLPNRAFLIRIPLYS